MKANDDILKQESDRKINHQEVMDDLLAIQDRAQKLWERLESSTNNILQQNQEAANQYIRTLEQLEQINKTVNFVWNLTNMMHTQVDEKLGWITDYISSTGKYITNFCILLLIIFVGKIFHYLFLKN